jgi:hypothetical protein
MDRPEDQEGITAYHGSPHDFDQFDISKIGTGEGAQSYGHGLYFAEYEPVALGYRDRLAHEIPSSGNTIADEFAVDPSTRKFMSNEDVAEHIEDINRKASKTIFDGGKQKYLFDDDSILTDEGDHFRAAQKDKGRMYQVHINAHPDHFLDWDKPLREQKHFLAPVLERFGGEKNVRDLYASWDKLNDDLTHEGKYDPNNPLWKEYDRRSAFGQERAMIKLGGLLEKLDKEAANPEKYPPDKQITLKGEDLWRAVSQMAVKNHVGAELLKEIGLPGIKYLDAGSRFSGADQATHNYVVFDDKLVNVKRKYAQGGMVSE